MLITNSDNIYGQNLGTIPNILAGAEFPIFYKTGVSNNTSRPKWNKILNNNIVFIKNDVKNCPNYINVIESETEIEYELIDVLDSIEPEINKKIATLTTAYLVLTNDIDTPVALIQGHNRSVIKYDENQKDK